MLLRILTDTKLAAVRWIRYRMGCSAGHGLLHRSVTAVLSVGAPPARRSLLSDTSCLLLSTKQGRRRAVLLRLYNCAAGMPSTPTASSSSLNRSRGAASSSTHLQQQPNHSSLSSIVSHLVRSSLGASAPASTAVPDDELDRHVAQVLLNEAKAKEKEMGFGSSGGSRTSWLDEREECVTRSWLSTVLRS